VGLTPTTSITEPWQRNGHATMTAHGTLLLCLSEPLKIAVDVKIIGTDEKRQTMARLPFKS
jgi:hypothetical protein